MCTLKPFHEVYVVLYYITREPEYLSFLKEEERERGWWGMWGCVCRGAGLIERLFLASWKLVKFVVFLVRTSVEQHYSDGEFLFLIFHFSL